MKKFEFEHEKIDYSGINAYWLGQASKLAYLNQDQILNTVKTWGLNKMNIIKFMI